MGSSEIEKGIVTSASVLLSVNDGIPDRDRVTEMVHLCAMQVGFDGDEDPLVTRVLELCTTQMSSGVSLVEQNENHDAEWVVKDNAIRWEFTDRYFEYLLRNHWAPRVVGQLRTVTERILGFVGNPATDGSWRRQGLVVGHVQSGKTANYIGLLARAADAGYRFLIIIAGIHNNLRRQTQRRIDEGFVGGSSDPAINKPIGVGLLQDRGKRQVISLTGVTSDFKKQVASQLYMTLGGDMPPLVVVIKKNVTTLKTLYEWLVSRNANDSNRITDAPLLMIDDEADNASINTKNSDIDPTKTNLWLRKILRLFTRSSYVGYTATPFANILINAESEHPEVKEDLFPRDFIYSLDPPNTYFGPDEVFGGESNHATETIDDAEDFLPMKHKKTMQVDELPPSLLRAVNQFFLAKAIRITRKQENHHCSMMVNVSRFIDVQTQVQSVLSEYVRHLKNAVMANYRMPDKEALRNPYFQSLYDEFARSYSDGGSTWKETKYALGRSFDNLKIVVVNSKSDEVLDYEAYERDGHGLTAIAVGGLSLSRGLTIEGLTISYMYRNTRMYDTLMQMGRWFGYRPGYQDLCRVYLHDASIRWYEHIAVAIEELRDQIRVMHQRSQTPKDFGFYILSQPVTTEIRARLLVTAKNKMWHGVPIKHNQSFSLKLEEIWELAADESVVNANRRIVQKYWLSDELGAGQRRKLNVRDGGAKGWIIEDVPTPYVEGFMSSFAVSESMVHKQHALVSFVSRIGEKYPACDVLLVSVAENEINSPDTIGYQLRNCKTVPESHSNAWRLSKSRVASRGDEGLGLSFENRKKAEENARREHPSAKQVSDIYYRRERPRPLLMIHLLSVGQRDQPVSERQLIYTYGMSFPDVGDEFTVEVDIIATQRYLDDLYGPSDDSELDGEDYDD